METKQCTKCGEVKEISEFHKKKAGRHSHCKSCVKEYYKANADKIKEYKKEYYKANADKIKEYKKEYRKANADKIKEDKKEYYKTNADECVLAAIKQRAKKKELPFDLELKDILGVTHCPVFGWELKRSSSGVSGGSPNSPSVDRKIPELGYVKGNIQILSMKANTMKQDATPEELIQFAEWILRTYQK